MSNVLEFFVKMKDMMSSGLMKIASTSDKAFGKVQNMVNQSNDRLDKLKDKVNEVDRAAKKSSFFNGSLFRNIATGIGVAGIMSFAGGAINKAMEFGMTKQSFQVLTGDKGKGESLANELNKLQQDTILGPSVFKNAQTMMGFGIAADRVVPTLKMLGDVSMGDEARLSSLTLAFSQVSAAGKLSGQDLLQMINAGYNPLNDISKMTGKSIGQLKKEMEGGAISADMVTKAFESATGQGGLYNKMLEILADTPMGKLRKLQGAFEAFQVKVGSALVPLATMLMDIGSFVIDNAEYFGILASAVGGYMVVTKGVAIATQLWTGMQWLLNAAMTANPLGLLIAAIAAITAVVVILVKKYDGWGKSMMGLWEVVKGFASLNLVAWKSIGETIGYWIDYAWLKTKSFVEWISGAMLNVTKALQLATEFKFGEAKAALTAKIEMSASKELTALERQHNQNKFSSQAAAATAVRQIATGLMQVGLTKKIGGSVAPSGISVNDTVKSNYELPTNHSNSNGSVSASGNGGGQRSVTINVNKALVENITINASNVDAGIKNIAQKVQEELIRILNSGVAIQ